MEGLLNQAGKMTVLLSSHELGEIDGVATHVAFWMRETAVSRNR